MTAEINDDYRIQLVVFERKAPHLPWEYTAAYKADTQEQCDASELTIRRTFMALHKDDGVEWAVLGMDERLVFSLMFKRPAPTFKNIEDVRGALALRFPEADDAANEDTPRCICGRMLAVIGERTICTGCGTEGRLANAIKNTREMEMVA
ncbi:MAG: hypothetical protein KF821_02020 [Anaerolineales bacterium]|nr:hypothetical protein [Anaerolineales bacterium]